MWKETASIGEMGGNWFHFSHIFIIFFLDLVPGPSLLHYIRLRHSWSNIYFSLSFFGSLVALKGNENWKFTVFQFFFRYESILFYLFLWNKVFVSEFFPIYFKHVNTRRISPVFFWGIQRVFLPFVFVFAFLSPVFMWFLCSLIAWECGFHFICFLWILLGFQRIFL